MAILSESYFVLTLDTGGKPILARSIDESVKPGDLVLIKDRGEVYPVLSADYLSFEELPVPPDEMLFVEAVAVKEELSKKSLDALEKTSQEEGKLQEDEDNEDFLFDEEEDEATYGPEESLCEGDLVIQAKVDGSFSLLSYEVDLASRLSDIKAKRKEEKTGYAFLESLRLENRARYALRGLTLRLSFSCDYIKDVEMGVPTIDKGELLTLRVPFLTIDRGALMNLDEPLPSELRIESFSPKGKLIASLSCPFLLLPIGEKNHFFDSDYRLLAKYVTPSEESVRKLTLDAVSECPFPCFAAYQRADWNERASEIGAVYEALAKHKIAYQNPPASSSPFQRVRLPYQVLRDHKGTCLDLSILLSSALLEIGFHPILVVLEEHALVGVFLNEEDKFENARSSKFGSFYNRVTGKGDILLIDAVNLANPLISFSQAIEDGKQRLRNYSSSFFMAVDVYSAHRSIFLPISTTSSESPFDADALIRSVKDEEIEPIIERKYREIKHESVKDRFAYWENKLLDLTEKNPLVNFHFSPSNFVRLIKKNLAETLQNSSSLPLKMIEIASSLGRAEQVDALLYSDESSLPSGYDPASGYLYGKERNFRLILSKNQSEIEESGAPTLYLCLGLLTYRSKEMRKGANARGNAPFLLLPVKIERKGFGSSSYTMSFDYEEVMLNKTFFEYYKLEHPDFDMSSLYSLDSGDAYEDIVATFKDKVEDDIKLDETIVFLANLTFSHYIMWLDMKKRKEELKENKIIASIVAGRSLLDRESLRLDAIEKSENYLDFAAPLPYDSTQLAAILESAEGKSFILDGPPGTGKSQTIVNMIVNAIYHGKTVLFVAEKKAALDVVAERLRKIKLDRFCLELHSSKANKRDFFTRLSDSMKLGPTRPGIAFRETVEELERRREEIKATVLSMHESKTYCLSFFEAITLDLNLSEKSRFFAFPEEQIISTKRKDYFASLSFLNSLITLIKPYGYIESSSLKKVGLTYFSFASIEKAAKDFSAFKDVTEGFLSSYSALLEGTPLPLRLSPASIEKSMKAFEALFDGDIFPSTLPSYASLHSIEELDPLFLLAKDFKKRKEEVCLFYEPVKAMAVEAEYLLEQEGLANNFFKRLAWQSKVKKTLQNAAISEKRIAKEAYHNDLTSIHLYQEAYRRLAAEFSHFSTLFPVSIFDCLSDLDGLRKRVEASERAYKAFAEFASEKEAEDYFLSLKERSKESRKQSFLKAEEDYRKLMGAEKEFFASYALRKEDFEGAEESTALDSLLSFLDEGATYAGAKKLVDIAYVNSFIEKSSLPQVYSLVDAYRKDAFRLEELPTIFEANYASALIKLYFDNRKINDFHPASFEATLSRYRSLITSYSESVIEEVSARATKNLTHGAYEYKESSSIGGLKKIISKAGRGISIRDVLIRYDDLIRQYFPCFLMSPLSAAQYLSVDNEIGTKRFDIVIFDEASQIPVHEAVGPIARGNSLIVAGDPQQMPPTTYFTSDISLPSDEVDNQDASSLLDECLAIEFPSIRLSYHYRSKHESLIDFSNKNFYEGDLHTFPSSSKGKKALSFEKVALSEKKIDSRLSEEETKAILKRLALIYGSEENKDKSVGIIVFNIKQKESLEKALESYLDKDKELARKIAEAEASSGDKLFIKSIENVQGDERDIILLCIGFRKSASGRAVIVGPLALSGGERRLNVAITRSKQRMYIISTIDDSDFDEDIYIANRGVLTLKHFLTYAKGEEVKASREEEFLTRKRLDIASFLCKDLERKGYLCDRDVGESKNKVDIAIRGEDKNTYALGILIDNDEEVSSSSLRDKEYVEPLVYNALNWKIIKVYAVSYYKNKAETLNRIILSMNKPYIRIETRLQPTIEKKEIDASYKATEYKSVDLETLPDLLYRPSFGFSPNIKAALLSIIEEEGPIAESLIKARVKQKIGMSALSPTAQLYLSNELRYFAPCLDADGFYWPPSKSEHTMEEFRFGGERDIAEIPYCEFASAFSQIEAIQGSLSDEDLFKATLEAFDYGAHKLTKKNKDVLEKMHARYVKK